jgi:excisionase family DNA binding protein
MAKEVPIAEKSLLTPEEAAAYFNIGVNKIRMMTDSPSCPYVLWSGSRRLIKRKMFEELIQPKMIWIHSYYLSASTE